MPSNNEHIANPLQPVNSQTNAAAFTPGWQESTNHANADLRNAMQEYRQNTTEMLPVTYLTPYGP